MRAGDFVYVVGRETFGVVDRINEAGTIYVRLHASNTYRGAVWMIPEDLLRRAWLTHYGPWRSGGVDANR